MICLFLFFFLFACCSSIRRLIVSPEWKIVVKMDYSDCPCMYQPAKVYKIKHLHKIEVAQNDPSGCTFVLVCINGFIVFDGGSDFNFRFVNNGCINGF